MLTAVEMAVEMVVKRCFNTYNRCHRSWCDDDVDDDDVDDDGSNNYIDAG